MSDVTVDLIGALNSIYQSRRSSPLGEVCKDAATTIESLRQQLAECQATNGKLRKKLADAMEWNWCDADIHEFCDVQSFYDTLALPNDATALNELIAERTKELTAENSELRMSRKLRQDQHEGEISKLTAEVERLKENYDLAIGITNTTLSVSDELRQQIAELTAEVERLKAAMPKNTKLYSECETKDDWRHKAMYYESQWSQCSYGFNKVAGELRQQNAELTAQRDAAEQRTAEACGNVVRDAMFKIGQSSPYRSIVCEALNTIRSGEWRKYK